jgi:hypothetical protein
MDGKVELIEAAKQMDWQQVVLNGGPPCFHLEGTKFCGRAERWAGHGVDHDFVPLHAILAGMANHERD